MIAKELISSQISPLHPDDTGEQALTMMNIYHVKHLPLVNEDEEYLCLLSEDEITHSALDKSLREIEKKNQTFVNESDHLFDVLAKIAEYNLTAIPVLDENKNFSGIISNEELLQHYANSFSFKEPGSIIVLEMSDSSYSLAEISRLIEGEHAKILSSQLTKADGENRSLVTLKINKQEISKIIATLERFDYLIKASFSEEDYSDIMQDRYDALMNFLNV